MRTIYCVLLVLFSLSACSEITKNKDAPSIIDAQIDEQIDEQAETNNTTENLSIPDNRFSSTYQILIFGNSHIVGLDTLIGQLMRTANPDAHIKVVNGGGGFLDNKSSLEHRTSLIASENWTHLILQGQKYSQSGTHKYSTTATELWVATAKEQKITPILFPEHPQKGNREEGRRVHQIHSEIAKRQKTCVAPVGLTWDKAIIIEPQLKLHNRDGNHASLIGKLLTAYVFYESITSEPADLLPYIAEIDVEETVQQALKQYASEIILLNPPCVFD
ncbi:hypothetical protein [Psychrosphaera algicola]|uniref:DUF218 domain-containing protein n=1 Tax=Psychrosphaera algicola TaxID=3023714 RepID=A0ABT5FJX2_9GAMM|nr:hypothetical protein [Psychrosphaera sp. G1-22]MDC2891493.1 hypothetical protein [Psychrosphaera sp. G1-22]